MGCRGRLLRPAWLAPDLRLALGAALEPPGDGGVLGREERAPVLLEAAAFAFEFPGAFFPVHESHFGGRRPRSPKALPPLPPVRSEREAHRLEALLLAEVFVEEDVTGVVGRLFAEPDGTFRHVDGFFEVKVGVLTVVLGPDVPGGLDAALG